MEGIILVATFFVVALFESGASHSFISRHFATRIGLKFKALPVRQNILTGNGLVGVDKVCIACPILVCGHLLSAKLIEFPMGNFDVILGIDLLRDSHATINCHEGRVIFKIPDTKEFTIVIASDDQQEGKIAIATVIEERFPRVIEEFFDVFPEELPGLPPVRDIEFCIELLPGTKPISERVYQMEPSELDKLYQYVEELKAKKFVRPSWSPWGAPVVLVNKKDGSSWMCIDYR